jgi:hypothetical protein
LSQLIRRLAPLGRDSLLTGKSECLKSLLVENSAIVLF